MDIKLTFSVDEINVILNALANRPYGEVFQLIQKIQAEGEKQIQQKPLSTESNGGV